MKYKKIPIIVEAKQWFTHGDHLAVRKTSYDEVSALSGCNGNINGVSWDRLGVIDTLEGKHIVAPGDYIILDERAPAGTHGYYYPCKPEIFEKTYERVMS